MRNFLGNYLLRRRKGGLPNYLSEMLLLLKIGLGISSSCELSLWCGTTYIFSQWPHLSELEHHGRYWVYWLAEHSWSADHFCWWLEDQCHRPIQRIVRCKWRTLKWSIRNGFGFVPRYRLLDNSHSERGSRGWQPCRICALAIRTTIERRDWWQRG